MDSTQFSTPTINWNSPNLKHAWNKFKRNPKLMFIGPLSGKAETKKCSYLLIWVGEKDRDIFNRFSIADYEQTVVTHLSKFDVYVELIANPLFTRYQFYKRNQDHTETVEQYVTSLKILAKECAFGNSEDERNIDRLVFGIRNDRIRDKLLTQGSTLTLTMYLHSLSNRGNSSATTNYEWNRAKNSYQTKSWFYKQMSWMLLMQ